MCVNGAPAGYMTDGTTRMSIDGKPVHHLGPATYAALRGVARERCDQGRSGDAAGPAALIGCAVATGVGAVINTAQARPGAWLAVFGCGGVGLNAVQA